MGDMTEKVVRELILHGFYIADIRVDHERVVGVINYKSRSGPIWFFYMFFLYIINLNFIAATALGIV